MLQKCLIGQKPEEVTGETDEFLLCLSLVAIMQTAAIKQISFVSTVTSSPVFTVRRSALHGLCDRNSVRPSVCPSVRLSHSWTVSTWFDL